MMSVYSFFCEIGRTKLEKKNAPIQTAEMKKMSGRMMRKSEIPAAFMAVSSKFSPIFPKVINEASRMANGKANGTNEKVEYTKNSASIDHPTPLPTKSATCLHKNCINKMKMQMRNVIKKSVKKRLNTYESIFLILNMPVFFGATKLLQKVQ